MKFKPIVLSFLVITLALPLGFYEAHADGQENDTDKNNTRQTEIENQTENQYNSTSQENIGLQVSNFVHNATAAFQQQRAETLQAIKECHQKMQNATSENRTQIRDECQATLTAIREKYHDVRKQFQELFKEFRNSMITLRHDAEGLHVSDQDREMAMKHIDDDVIKNGTKGIATAIEHMKGMGMIGIKTALEHVNKTNENYEYGHNTQNRTMSPMIPQEGQHGPPTSPSEGGSHGKR